MKKLSASIIFCLCGMMASAQFIYKIKADSVLITNDSCNAELNLENSTRNVLGFLYNKGNGRTAFKQGLIKINDTTYIIGNDTLLLTGGLSGLIAENGITKTGNVIRLGGSLNASTVINLQNKNLRFNSKDGVGVGNVGGITLSYIKDTLTSTDNLYLQNFHVGNKMNSFNSAAIFLESWWHSPSQVTSGGFANVVSRHKSLIAGTDYSGATLVGFRSHFENYAGQTFGKFIHFEASPIFSNSATINEYYGLSIATLKGPATIKCYAIYTAGPDDSIFNAGPVRWTRYPNNANEDSVLTTDASGKVKLKYLSGGSGGSGWLLNGNSGTNSANFLGTTDNVSLRFRTNNTERAIIDSSGNVGIGTTTPAYKLDVSGTAAISNLPFLSNRDSVLTYDPSTKQIKATKPSVPGTLINVHVLTSGTSYTPTTGTTAIYIEMVGGGGGGGGVTGANNSIGAAGGSGSGSYVTKYITGIGVGPYTYAIGTGGSAGSTSGGTGGNGGSTTLTVGGTTYTAPGGSGGVGQTAGTAAAIVLGGNGGTAGTNGDVNGAGQPGENGFRLSGTVGSGGSGGSSVFGGGGNSRNTAGAGNAAVAFGAGGGGALSTANTNQSGGVGSAGVIIIYEYK